MFKNNLIKKKLTVLWNLEIFFMNVKFFPFEYLMNNSLVRTNSKLSEECILNSEWRLKCIKAAIKFLSIVKLLLLALLYC